MNGSWRSMTCRRCTPKASHERTTAAPLCGSCGASITTVSAVEALRNDLLQPCAPFVRDERLELGDRHLGVDGQTRG